MKATAPIIIVFTATLLVLSAGCCRRAFPTGAVTLSSETIAVANNASEKVEVITVTDSSSFRALVKCDSLGNSYLMLIETLQGKLVNQAVSLKDNTITVTARAMGKTSSNYVRSDSVYTIREEVPVPYPVEKITNVLTKWQKTQIWVGRLSLVFVLLYVGFNIYGGKLNIVSKTFKLK